MKIKPTILALSFILLFLTLIAGVRGEYKPDHYEYPKLTSRALGMGGATVAWIDDASAIFHNPAGLGRLNSVMLSHAHSRNHFPGEIENLDQLDSDPTSLIIPLNGLTFGLPVGSAGVGWVLQGELGYDYRTRNDESIPQERLWGVGPQDRTECVGFKLWPGGYFGFGHRVSELLFSEKIDLPNTATWRRTGESFPLGFQQVIIPGIQYGYTIEDAEYDYYPHRISPDGEKIQGDRITTSRSGWCVRPTGWLTIARDVENVKLQQWPSKYKSQYQRVYWGAEIKLDPFLSFRWGAFDGHPTRGWSYKIGPWRSDSAWVDGFMEGMVDNYTEKYRDYHPTGFNLNLGY